MRSRSNGGRIVPGSLSSSVRRGDRNEPRGRAVGLFRYPHSNARPAGDRGGRGRDAPGVPRRGPDRDRLVHSPSVAEAPWVGVPDPDQRPARRRTHLDRLRCEFRPRGVRHPPEFYLTRPGGFPWEPIEFARGEDGEATVLEVPASDSRGVDRFRSIYSSNPRRRGVRPRRRRRGDALEQRTSRTRVRTPGFAGSQYPRKRGRVIVVRPHGVATGDRLTRHGRRPLISRAVLRTHDR